MFSQGKGQLVSVWAKLTLTYPMCSILYPQMPTVIWPSLLH
jgi:hypothetical protein